MTPPPTPVACERCGPLYFCLADFRQYYMLYSSSAGGGGFSTISAQSQQLRICICGEPLPETGVRRSGDDARLFKACVAAAKAHRAKQQPEALLQELLAELALKKDLAEAQERLANLERALRAIMAQEEPQE